MTFYLSRFRAITWTNWCGDFVNMDLQWQTSVQSESKYEISLSKCFNCKMLIIIMINERLVTPHGDIKFSHRWFRQRFVTGRLLPESMLTNHQWHDDVIKWKHYPRNWPFCAGNSPVPVTSPHKGQWRGALMFSLICVWINGWVNNREAGDLRRHRGHYDVIVMEIFLAFTIAQFHGADEAFGIMHTCIASLVHSYFGKIIPELRDPSTTMNSWPSWCCNWNTPWTLSMVLWKAKYSETCL